MTSALGAIFEDFYMCVSLIYKDKSQDNYSIFNEFLMNYTQILSSSNKKMTRGSVVKGLILEFASTDQFLQQTSRFISMQLEQTN